MFFVRGAHYFFQSVLGETIEAEWPFSTRAHLFPIILFVDFDRLLFSSPTNRLPISFKRKNNCLKGDVLQTFAFCLKISYVILICFFSSNSIVDKIMAGKYCQKGVFCIRWHVLVKALNWSVYFSDDVASHPRLYKKKLLLDLCRLPFWKASSPWCQPYGIPRIGKAVEAAGILKRENLTWHQSPLRIRGICFHIFFTRWLRCRRMVQAKWASCNRCSRSSWRLQWVQGPALPLLWPWWGCLQMLKEQKP